MLVLSSHMLNVVNNYPDSKVAVTVTQRKVKLKMEHSV